MIRIAGNGPRFASLFKIIFAIRNLSMKKLTNLPLQNFGEKVSHVLLHFYCFRALKDAESGSV